MSHTIAGATASCTINGYLDASDAALAVYDYLVNHPDEIPPDLDDYDSDEVVNALESYLVLEDGTLTISYETDQDEGNCDSEVFDFLCSHFACLQESPFMQVNWTTYDSRTGLNGGTDYYGRNGKSLDIEAILATHLTATQPSL